MDDLHISLVAEELFSIGPFPFTNSFLMMLIIMSAIILVGRWIASGLQDVPGRKQGAAEFVVEFLLNLVESTAGRRLGRQILPLIAGIFIFILIGNWSGLLPGVGTIGVYHEYEGSSDIEAQADEASAPIDIAYAIGNDVFAAAPVAPPTTDPIRAAEAGEQVLVPFFRPPNADLNMTIAMALITFTMVQYLGIKAHGVGGRLRHMASPPFMFPIELISEFSRIVSLSARLFGNTFAGEVLLTVMFTLSSVVRVAVIPLAIPVVFLGLELLFGFIQALVFAMLTMIYISLAAAGHGDHGHEAEHRHEPAHPAVPVAAGAGD